VCVGRWSVSSGVRLVWIGGSDVKPQGWLADAERRLKELGWRFHEGKDGRHAVPPGRECKVCGELPND